MNHYNIWATERRDLWKYLIVAKMKMKVIRVMIQGNIWGISMIKTVHLWNGAESFWNVVLLVVSIFRCWTCIFFLPTYTQFYTVSVVAPEEPFYYYK